MSPFSVAGLKSAASNAKNSSSDKLQGMRAKYASRSSADSSYDHRDMSTKAPPPPERVEEWNKAPPSHPGPPPPVRRNTRPVEHMPRPSVAKQEESEGIKWSSLSHNDKSTFFGWLDEYFDTNKTSPGRVNQNRSPSSSVSTTARHDSGTLSMSHPPRSEHGSAAQDFCVFFSSDAHWDAPWFSTQNPIPPPLEHSLECTRMHALRWVGDTRTLFGGVLFSDLSACWYTVNWSDRTASDTTKARRSAAFLPRPAALSKEDLIAAHETYGETVASFAEGYEGTGQWCARGECWDLANEALKAFEQWSYVPKPLPSIGKTHGHLIFEGKAWGKNAKTQQAGRWRGGDDCVRRGDIVQWKSATITERYCRYTLGVPDHTAIIVREQRPLTAASNDDAMRPADLGQLEVVEQSVHSPPSRKVYRLGGMEAGELWIYRPVGMEAYLSVAFSANWPEGLEPAVNG